MKSLTAAKCIISKFLFLCQNCRNFLTDVLKVKLAETHSVILKQTNESKTNRTKYGFTKNNILN